MVSISLSQHVFFVEVLQSSIHGHGSTCGESFCFKFIHHNRYWIPSKKDVFLSLKRLEAA
jgi:hypothetical protein